MHKALIFCSILFYSVLSLAQNKSVQVVVRDKISHETLIGVNISESNKPLGRTDVTGTCRLKLSLEKHQLSFSYTGYQTYQLEIDLLNHPIESLEILLEARSEALKQITVSGSRFEKRMAEEIVSIEVLKPVYVLQTANNQVDDALQRVAGVDVVENQVNIRGGSGWSYGAGSRVLVLVDDMPMLTADAGDAKWDFLPIENCEQIEVIKGASSCLYGSSALNGVINFRTGFARQKSKTKVMLYNGLYGNPPDKRWAWWGKQQPGFQGGYLMHAQKFGAWDMVLGSAWYNEDSYLQGDLNRRGRVNLNLRYRFPKVEGLIAGLNSNVQLNKSQTFFFWQPDSVNGTKYYQPFGGLADSSTTLNKNNGQRMNFDPYLSYTGRRGAKHILRTRYFRSNNDIPEKQQSSKAITGYGEYQFQKRIQHTSPWLNELNLITGLSGSYSEVEGALFGNHQIMNMAPYLQAEKKFGKLWTSLGMR
ncbi:MAG TPA: TonB-dependent receptor plug domain-containing protein, partial [Chitinophagaceae bacterium]|nr:TonB-dependent receptor plug domain-containing protein [Chitinophagaceae bacterium]